MRYRSARLRTPSASRCSAADGTVDPTTLEAFLRDHTQGIGLAEAALCRAGHRAAHDDALDGWVEVCEVADAIKTARESRAAGAVLGRRLLKLVAALESSSAIERAIETAATAGVSTQYAPAFGFAAGALGVDEDAATLAMLQQSVTTFVSAAQRAMPLGQTRATVLVWNLLPTVEDTARASASVRLADITCFSPMVDMASMRHPRLETRLFVS